VLGLGIGLIILPHQIQWFENHALIALVIEHLGLGFLVSSIAVFGYEWRSHTKMAVELSEKLAKILTERGKEALKLSLFAVLGDKED
jgi:hypothetical protein